MMKKNRLAGAVSLLMLIATISCKRTVYNHPDVRLTQYFLPLEIGKYAIYQLDSVNFYYYGQLDTLTQYLAKDTVESSFVDNQGRTSWVVVRYLSPVTGTPDWTPSETNVVTPSSQSIELVENNLRFIKLAYPLQDSLTWSGNSYIPDKPFPYNFITPENVNLNDWAYTYHRVNQPFTAGGKTYDSTLTILQIDDSSDNVPIVVDTIFASRSYWSETYAKNVGLIYRNTVIWEYQPATPNGSQSGYKLGFKVTLTLLEHN